MAIFQVVETTALILLLYTITTAIRRLYIHPLAHIPGPKLAALTWWYEFYYDGIQEGRYVFKIQELHAQYGKSFGTIRLDVIVWLIKGYLLGPIIRITPDELHINDVGFLDSVYAPSSSRRDKYEWQLKTLRIPGGIGTAVSHDVHKKRREALGPFFSRRNVLYLEPLIAEKVEQLCELITKHAVEKTPVNLSDVFFGFSNEYVFGVKSKE